MREQRSGVRIFAGGPLAQAVTHAAGDGEAALLARKALDWRADDACDCQPDRCGQFFAKNLAPRMMLVQHPAVAAFACDADEAVAIGARRIDLVPDQRLRGVTDMQACTAQALRHLGFLFMAGGTRAQALIEGASLPQGGGAEGHICAEHAAHLDHPIAVVGDRQIEIRRGRADFRDGIFGRQDAPLHRGEFGMLGEKPLDLGEVGSSTLRGTLSLPAGTTSGATAELWIDAGGLPDGAYQPFWSGAVALSVTGADEATGTATFVGLQREADPSTKSGSNAGLPAADGWPLTLSGTMTWTCEPW